MAQRIKPEDLPFDVPKFEEDAFIRKELISFKMTLVLFGYTILVALVTFFIWRATDLTFFPLLLLALAGGLALKPLFRILHVDISHWKRKEWVGTSLLYFLFWLGFVLLIFNPPFSDNAPPAIDAAVVPAVQGPGHPVEFAALIRDNRGVDEASILFCLHRLDGSQAPASYADLAPAQQDDCRIAWTQDENGLWRFTWTSDEEGTWAWFIRASDESGLVNERTGEVRITRPFSVFPPRAGPEGVPTFTHPDDRLTVVVAQALEVRAVQYVIDGRQYNMDFDDREGRWFTDPRYPGWQIGENVVTIRAASKTVWLDLVRAPGQPVLQDNATFTIHVDPGTLIGERAEPQYAEAPNLNRVMAPGPAGAWLLAALGAVALAVRRRR